MQTTLLHERDAARILGLSIHWLRRKRWEGGGPPYIKLDRAVRYELNPLLQWISEHRVGGSSEPKGNKGNGHGRKPA